MLTCNGKEAWMAPQPVWTLHGKQKPLLPQGIKRCFPGCTSLAEAVYSMNYPGYKHDHLTLH